ncbi:MAG TPA: CehA/McbA family metallohydrolase [Lacunisphaera sp.]|nr:CehA/McbA family metallohydrolase [Lacunisphaera sp.]
MKNSRTFLPNIVRGFVWLAGGMLAVTAPAHEQTLPTAGEAQALAEAGPQAASPAQAAADTCRLHVRLQDSRSHEPIGGLVRLTPLDGGAPMMLAGLFERPAGWFSMPAVAELKVPPGRYQIEAIHGIDTEVARETVECRPQDAPEVVLSLVRFYDTAAEQLHSANTHLHLLLHSGKKMGVDLGDRAEADAYLKTVGASDGLDLVYVSYLTAPGAEIASNEYTDDDFTRLSEGVTRFTNGVELRHGGKRIADPSAVARAQSRETKLYPLDSSRSSMTYGHVLLLDLVKRSMQASVGPGLSSDPAATDGVPLRAGILDGRQQGAGIVWCHGTMGLEAVPDWVAGVVDAQNIYDGGNEGTFDTVYYPYLNAGLKVPFSTGTDWGITDFNRVYETSAQSFTSKTFLHELTEGRTYITNEPFLEFKAGGEPSGGTIKLESAGSIKVRGRAIGRSDFVRLQLVQDGRIVREVPSRSVGGHFEADLEVDAPVAQSGWFALRIEPIEPYEIRSRYAGRGINALGKAIFAHTSPVYVSVGGRPVCDRAAVAVLRGRVDTALQTIDDYGTFGSDAEHAGIRKLYLEARDSLDGLLAADRR